MALLSVGIAAPCVTGADGLSTSTFALVAAA
ncbi:hypothetical protein LTSEURB_1692, partial [Salmonella enterica subsp. enterica serovar Urbana str. R8-2977]